MESKLKTFRIDDESLRCLEILKRRYEASDSEAIRIALRKAVRDRKEINEVIEDLEKEIEFLKNSIKEKQNKLEYYKRIREDLDRELLRNWKYKHNKKDLWGKGEDKENEKMKYAVDNIYKVYKEKKDLNRITLNLDYWARELGVTKEELLLKLLNKVKNEEKKEGQ